jgi:branched-chain amino acid transport system substrate-binding protein
MSRIARRRLLAGLGGAAVLAGAGPATAQTAGRPASTATELRLGALYPASGPLALLGDESFRGLELAVEARNEAGGLLGRPLKLVKADATDVLQAGESARRLIANDRVAAIFGTAASPLSFAATQVADLQGTPYFELGAIGDSITQRGFRSLFRSCPVARDYAALTLRAHRWLLPALWQVPVASIRLAILHEDGLYGQSVAEAQEAGLKEAGLLQAPGFLGRFGYAPGGSELAALVQRLRLAEADLLLHTGYDQETLLLFRAMKDAGWRPRMVLGAGAGYSMVDTAQALRPGFEGVMTVDFPPYASPGRLGAEGQLLAEAYRNKYGHDPRSSHSLANHAGARIFLDALGRAGSLERDRIRAAVLATELEARDAPLGWAAGFDENGQNRRMQPVLSQWQGGRLVAVFPDGVAMAAPRPEMG